MNISFSRKWTLLAVTVALFVAFASGGGNVFAQNQPYSEKEAQSIDRSLMCPVCPAETIDQAQVEIARQMRAVVRDMLGKGASRDEVLDFFVSRYGLEVLAAPPKSGVNILVWVLPIAGILAALAGGYFIIRSMSSRNTVQLAPVTVSNADRPEGDLEPFLVAVDRDLALLGGSGNTGASDQPAEGVDSLREHETNREDDVERNG